MYVKFIKASFCFVSSVCFRVLLQGKHCVFSQKRISRKEHPMWVMFCTTHCTTLLTPIYIRFQMVGTFLSVPCALIAESWVAEKNGTKNCYETSHVYRLNVTYPCFSTHSKKSASAASWRGRYSCSKLIALFLGFFFVNLAKYGTEKSLTCWKGVSLNPNFQFTNHRQGRLCCQLERKLLEVCLARQFCLSNIKHLSWRHSLVYLGVCERVYLFRLLLYCWPTSGERDCFVPFWGLFRSWSKLIPASAPPKQCCCSKYRWLFTSSPCFWFYTHAAVGEARSNTMPPSILVSPALSIRYFSVSCQIYTVYGRFIHPYPSVRICAPHPEMYSPSRQCLWMNSILYAASQPPHPFELCLFNTPWWNFFPEVLQFIIWLWKGTQPPRFRCQVVCDILHGSEEQNWPETSSCRKQVVWKVPLHLVPERSVHSTDLKTSWNQNQTNVACSHAFWIDHLSCPAKQRLKGHQSNGRCLTRIRYPLINCKYFLYSEREHTSHAYDAEVKETGS